MYAQMILNKLIKWRSNVSWVRRAGALSCWYNANNQKYILVVLLKMTFLDFSRKS